MAQNFAEIVDQAYVLWGQNPAWKVEDFLNHLDPLSHEAVVFHQFHNQVSNGGLQQWSDNGYAVPQAFTTLFRLFTRLGTTSGNVALHVLIPAAPEVEQLQALYEVGGSEVEEMAEPILKNLNGLDELYYTVSRQLVEDFSATL